MIVKVVFKDNTIIQDIEVKLISYNDIVLDLEYYDNTHTLYDSKEIKMFFIKEDNSHANTSKLH